MNEFSQVIDFQVDSRKVKRGSLFFALPGEKVDGHDFLDEISEKKAYGAVILDDCYRADLQELKQVLVPDVLEYLQNMAKKTIDRDVIAITGSFGKTSVKEFLSTILSGLYKVAKTPENANSQIGLPLALLNMQRQERDLFVLEMGVSQKGEMDKLQKIAPAKIAIITGIGHAHIENFGSKEAIFEEKMKIAKHSEIVIVPHEWKNKLQEAKVFSFSAKDARADFYIQSMDYQLQIIYQNQRMLFSLPFDQKHFMENAAIAAIAAYLYGMTWKEIELKMQELKIPKMRFDLHKIKDFEVIFDAYNASYESVLSSMDEFKKREGRRILILADMKEVGDFSKKLHEDVGEKANDIADILLTYGQDAKWAFDKFQKRKKHFDSIENLAFFLKDIVRAKDQILLKGSRSMGLENFFSFEPFFSDRYSKKGEL
ncbi:MAG TPA: UDP-N-acetylmuramoyl-tripeptide--D-alanyl-D-alanine ligase [Chlamydiales bacterium]|nr:UDP-N-acetylmuramoyl-tripeptide--D-alanyl-D-alanine ligase [Chlamydiales bacterium]